MSLDIHLTNVTSPAGFTDAAIAALRVCDGVHEVIATADPDGRYRDVWFRSTVDVAARFAMAAREQE
jgi:hypothetical protein